MKRLIIMAGLVFIGVAAWRISERLSADAIGMALGVLFGIVAGLPVAMLVLAANRRREERTDRAEYGQPDGRQRQLPQGYPYPMPQPPVIVLAGHPGAQMPNGYGYERNQMPPMYPALPAPPNAPQERRFKVVGEQEEWIDEY